MVDVHRTPAAHWRPSSQDSAATDPAMSSVRYYRFTSPVTLTGAELPEYHAYFLIRPRHLRIFSRPAPDAPWEPLYDNAELPDQELSVIDFPRPATVQWLKAEVLAHHGSTGAHREIAQNPRVVPLGTLDALRWRTADGDLLGQRPAWTAPDEDGPDPAWHPPLHRIADASGEAPDGVTRTLTSNEVVFDTGRIRIGLSLLRPLCTRFSWDTESPRTEERPRTGRNLLSTHADRPEDPANGPWLARAHAQVSASSCGGTVQVGPNWVRYTGVSPVDGVERDHTFTVDPDGVVMTVDQRVTRETAALECEAWRWVWDTRTSITATLAVPDRTGRTGRCRLPALLHAPNQGTLAVELVEGDPETVRLAVDSWRDKALSWTGLQLGTRLDDHGELVLAPGDTSASLRIRPADLRLDATPAEGDLPAAFRRSWGDVFGYRPEYYGMSNNASSINCHFVQHVYTDLAAHTLTGVDGLDVLELCADSTELALSGGAGYGDNRTYFVDSDASLLISAGAYLARTENADWARRCRPELTAAAQRLLERRTDPDHPGLLVCGHASGNSGERHWSTNWWDVISFGHLDAFANALAYRGLRQAESIARLLGDDTAESTYRDAADALRRDYRDCFLNPETGWLAGWRSRDGKLHDYGFLFVNGIAAVYGLLSDAEARTVLARLEAARVEAGFTHFHLGLPGPLFPVRREDHVPAVAGSPLRADGRDTYGVYQNGGASMSQAYFYLRALGMYGFEVADEIGTAVLDAFEHGDAVGGLHEGNDWRYWDGRRCGYEGLLSDQLYVLLAVAQNRGLVGETPMAW